MPKFSRELRDLKTIRETELIISRRFRRKLDDLDYSRLKSDLKEMYKDGMSRGAYSVFYFKFSFKILDIDSDDLTPDLQKYILENLRRRFKGRFEEIESAPDSDFSGYGVFGPAFKARLSDLDFFLSQLEILFDKEVLSKFNAEVDHDIYLTGASIVLKKARRTKAPRRGIRKKRKTSHARITVFKIKGRAKRKKRQLRAGRKSRRRQTVKRRTARSVKRSRKSYKKARRGTKKSRRF